MNTPSKPRRQAFLAVALALTSSILFFTLLVHAQSSNSPELSYVEVPRVSGRTSQETMTVAPSSCSYGCSISISPTLPTEYAPVQVSAGGEWSDSCVPLYESHQVTSSGIRMDFAWFPHYPPGTFCFQVITPWGETVDVGPLTSGVYGVQVYIDGDLCSTGAFTVFDAPDVALSEIAWMGTTVSPDDEWIELFNNTGSPIDLSGWTLTAADGSPTVSLSGSIPSGGYFLLERTDDDTVPEVDADQLFTGALNNEGEDLVLRNDAATVVDRVDCSTGWFAGHAEGRVPMVRVDTRADGSVGDNWTHNPRCGTATNSTGISRTCTLSVTTVGHALDYGVYFNQRAITATTTTTEATLMEEGLLGLIKGATTSIDVALYGLNRQSVIDTLTAAHDSGVTVRVVGDDDAATGEYSEGYQALTAAGITVITDTSLSKVQHNSFLVFDGQIVWTGSTDLTDSGLTLDANNSIVITDTVLATIYTDEFEEMWAGNFHKDKTDNTTHLMGFDDHTLESYFSPTDLVAFEVWGELADADESIHFGMFSWTDSVLTQRVVERLEAGAKVYGVWDQVGAADPFSVYEALIEAGAQIRIEDFPGKLYHKFAVIDVEGSDPTVILGSYDWTDAGAYDNDENTLIISNRELARAYYREWWRLWAASRPVVSFASPTYTVGEADGSASIGVTLDATSTLTTTVGYVTSNGTAVAGSDYLSASGTLTFAPGITLQTFAVSILNDSLFEARETITLTLSDPANGTLGIVRSAELTILDDDAQSHVLLPLVMKNAPATTLTGIFSIAGNPCTTDPCLPCVVLAVRVNGTYYHLTVDGAWLWCSGGAPPSWDGYTPEVGDRVTVTGYASEHMDIFGRSYYNIEVVSLVPAQ